MSFIKKNTELLDNKYSALCVSRPFQKIVSYIISDNETCINTSDPDITENQTSTDRYLTNIILYIVISLVSVRFV